MLAGLCAGLVIGVVEQLTRTAWAVRRLRPWMLEAVDRVVLFVAIVGVVRVVGAAPLWRTLVAAAGMAATVVLVRLVTRGSVRAESRSG
ncbi:hypothetical protein SAMN05443575_0792 [Jatrophihabitans endophyticus]|uniref:Uncharacterized protein n=1 Tax=Jatrophihabitans endophyticus TaxID=1206085 RepID=A0A1M5E5L2_9ACTN|nr:hypothetical protein SAMN05443575_0792 [Jatrophihabitans endophyticus]